MSDKSLGILAGSLFSILFVFTLIYFGPQTITYVRMRPLLLRTPDAPPRGWGSAPEPLEELEVPTARRFVISWDGYQFEVPRGELKSERGDGMIASRQDTEFVSASLRLTPLIRQLFIVTFQTLRSFSERLFTNRSTNNLGKIVSAVPSGWSPLQSHRAFRRYEKLLEIKGLWFEHNPVAPDVLSFQTGDYRGFELSGLRRGWQNVTLDCFDTQNHWFVVTVQGDEIRA